MHMSNKRAACMQANSAQAVQASPGTFGAEELIEPTLVLPFPAQAASALQSTQPAAASVKAVRITPLQTLAHQPARSPSHNAQLGHLAAQACNLTGSLEAQSSALQAGQTGSASMAPVCQVDPIAATGSCTAGVPVQYQPGGRSAGSAQQSDAESPRAVVNTLPEIPATVQQCQLDYSHQEQAVAQPQLDVPLQQAGTGRQPTLVLQEGSVDGQAVVAKQDSNRENSDEGATSADGQTSSLDGQGARTAGDPREFNRQAGEPDKPALIANGKDGGIKGQDAVVEGQPAVQDDTISEACCVCKFAEDGEVMLLCDKCDLPAHLGCVGLEAVPEGDWFCPTCATSAMVSGFCLPDTSHESCQPHHRIIAFSIAPDPGNLSLQT